MTIALVARRRGGRRQRLFVRTAFAVTACGYDFEVGRTYLVYAYRVEGALYTGRCSRTALPSDALPDPAALGACRAAAATPRS